MPTIDEVQAALAAERRRVEAQVGIAAARDSFADVARTAAAAGKRKRADAAPAPAAPARALPLRRSPRAALQAVPFAPTGLASDADVARAGRGQPAAAAAAAAAPTRVTPVTGMLRPDTAAESGSLKSYRARVPAMNDAYLGRLVPASLAGGGFQAKASVIYEACERPAGAALPRPKFNKYAGLQQYSNAFILFVNIGVRSEDGLTNSFGDDGGTITWFAAASATEQTPAILRLRHHATGHAYECADGSRVALAPAAVALVCRLPAAEYVWCGDLELVSMDPGSRPLGFVWRLKHAARLRGAAAFRALLQASL